MRNQPSTALQTAKALQLTLAVTLMSLICSCSPKAASFEILFTGNLQGQLDTIGGRLVTLSAMRQAEMGDNFAMVDGGDFLKSNWYVDYSDLYGMDSQHICSQFFNAIGCDAVVMGNHDLTAGMPVLKKVARELDAKVLAANVIDRDSGRPAFGSYKIYRNQGLKIAVVGMVNPMIANNFPASTANSLEVRDLLPAAREVVGRIRKRERPDMLVLVAHSKYDDHVGTDNDLAAVLAQVPGIDVCLDSHTHETINRDVPGPDGATVKLVGMSAGGTEAASIMFRRDNSGKCFVEVEHIDTRSIEPDHGFVGPFAEALIDAKAFRDEAICKIDTTISVLSGLEGPSAWAALVHEACREGSLREGASSVGIDVSLATIFLEKGEIRKGVMTYDDFCKLAPFDDHLCVVEMTAGELRKLLDHNIMRVWENYPDNFLYFMDDADAVRYDAYWPPVGGTYVKCSSIDGVHSAGYPDSQVLHILMSAYRAHDGGYFISRGLGWKPNLIRSRILWESESSLRTMLIRWCRQRDTIKPRPLTNWTMHKGD